MKVYLVGGAVRDKLLGLPVHERDYVVVGANVEEMLEQGFQQVGKDFPVFLHPQTKEEYALARKERKVGLGYTGFTFDASPFVSLEEDLLRRDLTINAIAEDDSGELIDPFHGQSDIQHKILRHVSAAFVEDPVRILRLARFAARFAHLGFTIALETMALMQQMVKLGEVDALVADRVWKEFEKVLQTQSPQAFFNVLEEAHALPLLFPWWDANHAGVGALKSVASLALESDEKFALLAHTLCSLELTQLVKRYPVPNSYKELADLLIRFYPEYARSNEFSAEEMLAFFQSLDGFRREERFVKVLTLLDHVARFKGEAIISKKLDVAFEAAKSIQLSTILQGHEKGAEIAILLKNHRIRAIQQALS